MGELYDVLRYERKRDIHSFHGIWDTFEEACDEVCKQEKCKPADLKIRYGGNVFLIMVGRRERTYIVYGPEVESMPDYVYLDGEGNIIDEQ